MIGPYGVRSQELTCVTDDRHELAMVGSGGLLETNFDAVSQTVPNQGLLISMPMSVEDYAEEGWFYSRRFAKFPESRALLTMTNFCGRSVLTRLGTWQERWKHVGKRACVEVGAIPLRTVCTVEYVDLPWLRLREHVDYQKA